MTAAASTSLRNRSALPRSFVTIDSVCLVEYRRMWLERVVESSRRCRPRGRGSCARSPSPRRSRARASGRSARTRSSAWMVTPGCLEPRRAPAAAAARRRRGARAASRARCRRSAAAPWRCARARPPTSSSARLVEEHVHDAGTGLDDGHARLVDDGADEPGAAARDEHVDVVAGLHEVTRAVRGRSRRRSARRRRAARRASSASRSTSTSTRLVCSAALPPRSTTALPLLSASTAMSIVTFGRAS